MYFFDDCTSGGFLLSGKATKKNKKQKQQSLQYLSPKQHNHNKKMSQFKSAVQEFIDGEDNSMGFVLKSIQQQNNQIVIGDEEDDLFTIVVLDASNGKFVRGGGGGGACISCHVLRQF